MVSNRTEETRTGSVPSPGTTNYSYNAKGQLASTTRSGTTTGYSYDLNGNLASAGARTFTHNLAGQQTQATIAGVGGGTTAYAYDGDGRRVSSSGPGAELRFVWDPQAETGIPEPILERKPGGTLVRRYLNGPLGAYSFTTGPGAAIPGLPDPVPQPGEVQRFYLHHDPLGSVSDVTGQGGAAQWAYSYDGFGQELEAINVTGLAPENRLRFTGQYLDPETTLYHLRARQYDPALGRFTAPDPVEPAADQPFENPYVYVGGRPTVLVDPLGQFGIDLTPDFVDDAFDDVTGVVADVPGAVLSTAGDVGEIAVDVGEAGGNGVAAVASGVSGGLSNDVLNSLGIHPDETGIFGAIEDITNIGSTAIPGLGVLSKGVRGLRALCAMNTATVASRAATSRPGRFLFGRHRPDANPWVRGRGVLNRAPVRVGWGWKGTATDGNDVFRIGLGKPGRRHIDIFDYRQ